MKKLFLILLISPLAFGSMSSFYEHTDLGYTPLNQAGDTALGAFLFAPTTDVVPVTVQAGTSIQQNALQEWKNFKGDVLASVEKDGTFVGKCGCFDNIQLTGLTLPACNADSRGTMQVVRSGAGVSDKLEVCAKDAIGSYGWKVIPWTP